jgi:tyrosinase
VRRAYSTVLPIQDERGYNHHAGIHGLPLPIYCKHGDLLFLP